MKPIVHIPVLALLALAGQSVMATEPGLDLSIDDWDIRGSNTVRIEHYDTDGDPSASPYRFGGTQTFDEFRIDMRRRANPWDLWRVQASGLLNHSNYRSLDRGVVPERIALTRERGDVALPYRVEVGDYFGYFSYRTLQRSLKGARVELQPGGFGSWRNSVVLLVGENQSRWKKFQLGDNLSSGVSWLTENAGVGSFGLNLVHNLRQSDPSAGALQRSQIVLSAVARTNRTIGGLPVALEAELAHFTGDHNGLSGAASGQDRSDNGLYIQASSRSRSPFSYRFRYERYGQDYRPSGAVVPADHRAAEAHAGYRFDNGLSLRARALSFRDALETANPTDTDTHGFTLSGPLFTTQIDGLSAHLDFFHQEVEDRNQTVNLDTDNLNLEFSKRLPQGITGRLGALLRAVHDDTGGGASATTWELKAGLDAPLERGGWRATFSPELRLRRIQGSASDGMEVIPRLALAASRGPHRASLDLSYRHQERDPAASADLRTLEVAMRYGYTRGANTFGVQFSTFNRNPDPGADTEAYRASLFWTHAFQRPARKRPTAGAALTARTSASGGTGQGSLLLSALAPGISISEAQQILTRAGLGTHTAVGTDIQVYEARLLADVDQRQRVVIVSHANTVERSALLIDLDATGGGESTEQLFERVRRRLVNEFGRPASFFDRGQFSPALASDLGAERFLRITEWDLPEGVLRFGIPRRLDGTVRMELQFARGFPEPQRSDWSLDRVR